MNVQAEHVSISIRRDFTLPNLGWSVYLSVSIDEEEIDMMRGGLWGSLENVETVSENEIRVLKQIHLFVK